MNAKLSATMGNVEDESYEAFLGRLNARFAATVYEGVPLFKTDATGLWEAYLASFGDVHERQHHNCTALSLIHI